MIGLDMAQVEALLITHLAGLFAELRVQRFPARYDDFRLGELPGALLAMIEAIDYSVSDVAPTVKIQVVLEASDTEDRQLVYAYLAALRSAMGSFVLPSPQGVAGKYVPRIEREEYLGEHEGEWAYGATYQYEYAFAGGAAPARAFPVLPTLTPPEGGNA